MSHQQKKRKEICPHIQLHAEVLAVRFLKIGRGLDIKVRDDTMNKKTDAISFFRDSKHSDNRDLAHMTTRHSLNGFTLSATLIT